MIIQWLIRLYTALLRLYPPSFRAEFAQEMEEVFSQAVQAASVKSVFSLAYLCLNELVTLPVSLVRVRRNNHSRQRSYSALPLQVNNLGEQTWQELVLALAVFLLPAGVILNLQNPQFPHSSGLLAAILFLVVMILMGWLGGLPLWSLSYVGIVLVVAGYLVLFQWVASLASPALIANFTPGLLDRNAYLLLQVASTGMLWLMLFCLTLLVVALLAVFNRFRPFFGRVRHDWTLITYILYGESVFALLFFFESHRYDPVYTIAGLLCLLAGIWFYLRSTAPGKRLAVLSGCLTLAVCIAVIAKWPLSTEIGWPSWSDLRPTEVGRLLLSWLWMVAALSLPGLLARFPARRGDPRPPSIQLS